MAALGIYANVEPPDKALSSSAIIWFSWLLFVSLALDVDYVIPYLYALRASIDTGLRITHSVFVSLLLPLCTILVLSRLRLDRDAFRAYSIQVGLVGLSHIAMDMLVGVWPLPLSWPLSAQVFRLPFGILPSAPVLDLSNPYMYRNLLMEVGILAPLCAGLYLVRHSRRAIWQRRMAVMALWGCSISFMGWAYTLVR